MNNHVSLLLQRVETGTYKFDSRRERQVALALLEAIREDLPKISGDDARTEFIQRVVTREARRISAGDRDRPVCTCSELYCPIKAGRLPPAIEQADGVRAGLTEWRSRHPRSPVLAEARREWERTNTRVATLLDELRTVQGDGETVEDSAVIDVDAVLDDDAMVVSP